MKRTPVFNYLKYHRGLFFAFALFFVHPHKGYCRGEFPPTGLLLTVTTKNPSCDNRILPISSSTLGDGSIMASASGGTPPYTYSLKLMAGWQNNGYFPGLRQGNYDVVVKDAQGETVSQAVYLSNTLPQPLMGTNILQVPSSCTSADGSLELLPYGGTPPYTFSTDAGVSYHSGGTILTNLQQGAYYTFFLKDANGCIAVSGTSAINSGSHNNFVCNFCCALQIQALADKLPCDNDGQLEVWASYANPPVYYSLDGVNYQIGNGTNHYGNTFYNLTPGTYHIYAKDAYGSITQGTYVMAKACGNSLNYVGTDAGCKQSNGSITMAANFGSGPYIYTLDGTNYQNSNVFSGLAAGNYNIAAKDALGATGSGIAVVLENCPALTVVTTIQSCGNADGTITAQGLKGTAPYLFSIDGVHFQADNIFTGLLNGNYTITLKDAGGITVSTPAIVHSDNCLQLIAMPENTTCGNANGSITVNAANGTMPYQYSKDGINYIANNVFSGLMAGTYTVSVKDALGFTTTGTAILADEPAPGINIITTQASCKNKDGSITITGTGGKFPFQYSINNGAGFQNNAVFTNLDSGRYMPLIKDANGCMVDTTIQLTALPTPVVFLGNDTTLCEGVALLLVAPASLNYQYQWQDNYAGNVWPVFQPGTYSVKVTNQYNCTASDTINIQYRPLPFFSLGKDTIICSNQSLLLAPEVPVGSYLWNTGSTTPSINVNTSGTYWLRLNINGCAFTDSISIGLKSAPIVNLGKDTTICEGQTLLLNAVNNNALYSWQDGSLLPVFTVSGPGYYAVQVNEDGCIVTGKIMVRYTTKPVNKLAKDTSLCITEQLVLNASFPQSTYKWQDGSGRPEFTVTREGMYTVRVSNDCGITNDTVTVKYENCACHFYMPNVFTADHDGKNDVFRPKIQCLFSGYALKIFNRFGQLIFNTTDPVSGWNGTFKGNDQPAGGYIWMMQYVDRITGKSFQQKGTVLLLR